MTNRLPIYLTGTSGGNVGLAITQAIGLTGMFQWGMRQSAELENQMTSVERVLEYGKAPREANLESPPGMFCPICSFSSRCRAMSANKLRFLDDKPPPTWPSKGEVVFDRMYLKYEPQGQYVLKNLNFTIKPEEKVRRAVLIL